MILRDQPASRGGPGRAAAQLLAASASPGPAVPCCAAQIEPRVSRNCREINATNEDDGAKSGHVTRRPETIPQLLAADSLPAALPWRLPVEPAMMTHACLPTRRPNLQYQRCPPMALQALMA